MVGRNTEDDIAFFEYAQPGLNGRNGNPGVVGKRLVIDYLSGPPGSQGNKTGKLSEVTGLDKPLYVAFNHRFCTKLK